MYKIGIIGTENSHALAFAKIINLPVNGKRLYPDAKVVGAFGGAGGDEASAQAIVDQAGAEFVATCTEDFFGKVDAMIITNRKGSLHMQYAMPFIEKGLPVFIDKPFTSNIAEAEALIAAAQKHGALLSGGSACKLAYDVQILQSNVQQLIASDNFISASINYAADTASEYDGFFFYAPHLTEMTLTIFGPDVNHVLALENSGTRTCILRYGKYDISLHYTKDAPASSCVLYAKNGNTFRNIDMHMCYELEVAAFINMLRTGEMPAPYESLVLPVRVMSAIEESVKTWHAVAI